MNKFSSPAAYCTSGRYNDIFAFGSTETDFSSHTIDPLREILLQFDSFSSELTVSCRAPGELLGHLGRVDTFCHHGTNQTVPVYKGSGIIHTAAEEQRSLLTRLLSKSCPCANFEEHKRVFGFLTTTVSVCLEYLTQ